IEKKRVIDAETLKMYLPNYSENKLPVLFNRNEAESSASFASEREILYKILFDMKADMNDLKKLVYGLIQTGRIEDLNLDHQSAFDRLYKDNEDFEPQIEMVKSVNAKPRASEHIEDTHEVIEESLSLQEKEKELIIKALNKHNGKRKLAAEELGISERTLYRKIKEYDLD
ncbi:MAG TPA: helix-turn-helix domain-containing protein, partial [Bacteroidales bacterium]|nr:helix-turn-helix domain-containing protein [Bacteroidales bacterium]